MLTCLNKHPYLKWHSGLQSSLIHSQTKSYFYWVSNHALYSRGNTSWVPLLVTSWSVAPKSRSSASSELLFVLLLSRLVVAVWGPEEPFAVIVVSPYVTVRSPSFRIKSESSSRSCSWFWIKKKKNLYTVHSTFLCPEHSRRIYLPVNTEEIRFHLKKC